MNKGILTKTAIVAGLSIFMGFGCSHKHSKTAAAPSEDAQLESIVKKEYPSFSAANTKGFMPGATLSVSKDSITLTTTLKAVGTPIAFIGKNDLITLKGGKLDLTPSESDATVLQAIYKSSITGKAWCVTPDCGQIAVVLENGNKEAQAAAVFYETKTGYLPGLNKSGNLTSAEKAAALPGAVPVTPEVCCE